MNLFAKKNLTDLANEASGQHELRRALGPWNLITLVICTVLYITVSALLTHLIPYSQLNVPDPVVQGVRMTGHCLTDFNL
jgi:hypothetical protein